MEIGYKFKMRKSHEIIEKWPFWPIKGAYSYSFKDINLILYTYVIWTAMYHKTLFFYGTSENIKNEKMRL